MDSSGLTEIFDALTEWTGLWGRDESRLPPAFSELLSIILAMHQSNFCIWNQEDIARRTDVADAVIVGVKRTIDRLNQQRTDLIERIDQVLLDGGYSRLLDKELPMRAETPGSVLDRLSILSLKIYHMRKQTERSDADKEHIELCRVKLEVLLQQQSDLRAALTSMFDELNQGKIRFKIYRQYKMYNDPNLNPQLYMASKKQEV